MMMTMTMRMMIMMMTLRRMIICLDSRVGALWPPSIHSPLAHSCPTYRPATHCDHDGEDDDEVNDDYVDRNDEDDSCPTYQPA